MRASVRRQPLQHRFSDHAHSSARSASIRRTLHGELAGALSACFSEFVPSAIGEDGRFGYPYLVAYWQECERFSFLIRVDAALAGFALVRQGSLLSGASDVMDIPARTQEVPDSYFVLPIIALTELATVQEYTPG